MATYHSGSGTDDIIFKYIVIPNHWSLSLRISHLSQKVMTNFKSSGYIRSASDHPSTNANLTFPFHDMPFVQNGAPIQVNGRIPVINEIFVSGNQSSFFKEREDILITVKFSSEVMFIVGPPVLSVSIGKQYFTEASYFSGNQSDTFQFSYSVAVGDMSPPAPIACRMLCVSSGCVQGVSTEGYIKQYSSNSSLDADLALPFPNHGKILIFLYFYGMGISS